MEADDAFEGGGEAGPKAARTRGVTPGDRPHAMPPKEATVVRTAVPDTAAPTYKRLREKPRRTASFAFGYRTFAIHDALGRHQSWHVGSVEVSPLRRWVRLDLITEIGGEGGAAARDGDKADLIFVQKAGLGVQYPGWLTPFIEFQGGVGGARVELFDRNDLLLVYTLGIDAGAQWAATRWLFIHAAIGWLHPTFPPPAAVHPIRRRHVQARLRLLTRASRRQITQLYVCDPRERNDRRCNLTSDGSVRLRRPSLLAAAACQQPAAASAQRETPAAKADAAAPTDLDAELSCEARCGDVSPECSCDAECDLRGDCCPDAADHCSVGTLPSTHLGPGGLPCSGTVLVMEHYVICHDDEARVPQWTAYHLTAADLRDGDVERTDDFRSEPALRDGQRAELTDYVGSGFDRGHMAPAGDFARSLDAMSSTFSLANMAPQERSLNSGPWRVLEDDVRQEVLRFGRGWVVTGTLFLNEDGASTRTPSETIGASEVWVPSHCFKLFLNEHANGEYTAYAFVFPNARVAGRPVEEFAATVDELEHLSGLDFLAALDPEDEADLESDLPVWRD